MEKTHQTVGTVPKSNKQILERAKIDTPKQKYMATHFAK
jgi:hypothetical protein